MAVVVVCPMVAEILDITGVGRLPDFYLAGSVDEAEWALFSEGPDVS